MRTNTGTEVRGTERSGGRLVLDILLISLKKVVRENGIFSEFAEARLEVQAEKEPF